MRKGQVRVFVTLFLCMNDCKLEICTLSEHVSRLRPILWVRLQFEHQNWAEAATGCDPITHDSQQIAAALLRHQLRSWWDGEEKEPCLIKSLKMDPGTALYLLHDPALVAKRRARLRFDRSSLNKSLFRRRLAASPYCPDCPNDEDTAEHILLHCQRYDAARSACDAVFRQYNVHMTLATLLGELGDIRPSAKRLALLQASSTLLAAIKRVGP